MTHPDPYRLHRLALLPLVSKNRQQPFDTVGSAVTAMDEEQFANFILLQNLGPFWHEALKEDGSTLFSTGFADKMKEARLTATAQYLRQQHTLKKAEDIFRTESIPYAVFKGAHIRELIYSIPAVRPACDIDILIAEGDRGAAIKALVSAGYSFQPLAENISHEATLTDGHVSIDLHWHIMRPGRMRKDMTDEFLAAREEFSGYWGLSDEATLFIMLVHPVFTKYLNSPNSSLMRVVDLAHWIEQRRPDWDKVYSRLNQTGLCTAAWITLEWLKILTEITPPASFLEKIHPGRVKARYLRFWLNQDYSTRLFGTPMVIKVAFTLPVHDKMSDAVRATRSLLRANYSSTRTMKMLGDSISE